MNGVFYARLKYALFLQADSREKKIRAKKHERKRGDAEERKVNKHRGKEGGLVGLDLPTHLLKVLECHTSSLVELNMQFHNSFRLMSGSHKTWAHSHT